MAKTDSDFPKEDKFLDFAGKERRFEYLVTEIPMGFVVRAVETKENGYEFQAFSATSPFHVLGELRHKIRKRLSTRYLQKEKGLEGSYLHLYHEEAKGHITYGGVVIDGMFIPFDELNRMIQTYEGWMIEIKISELSDE